MNRLHVLMVGSVLWVGVIGLAPRTAVERSAATWVIRTPKQAPPPSTMHRVTPAAGATKWSWIVYDGGNKSIATVLLRQRLDNVGTTQQSRTSYQIENLGRDMMSVGDSLEPGKRHVNAFNGGISINLNGESYRVNYMPRAKTGAREEDFHAILSDEEDESRVAVYVLGPTADVRHKILADMEALYGKRPEVLDCMNAGPKASPKHAACYPNG